MNSLCAVAVARCLARHCSMAGGPALQCSRRPGPSATNPIEPADATAPSDRTRRHFTPDDRVCNDDARPLRTSGSWQKRRPRLFRAPGAKVGRLAPAALSRRTHAA